jgi:hypothetical protein
LAAGRATGWATMTAPTTAARAWQVSVFVSDLEPCADKYGMRMPPVHWLCAARCMALLSSCGLTRLWPMRLHLAFTYTAVCVFRCCVCGHDAGLYCIHLHHTHTRMHKLGCAHRCGDDAGR